MCIRDRYFNNNCNYLFVNCIQQDNSKQVHVHPPPTTPHKHTCGDVYSLTEDMKMYAKGLIVMNKVKYIV